ncbi:MAG: ATP synthase subunit I [Desulfobacterales bacterium]|nr:ATP synthase subunit I [Desulfobacterales bacterium]MCP4164043.1 ATP synthase subunit I [Deltaproteobacteria bacterium]
MNEIQNRIVSFVTKANWLIFAVASVLSLIILSYEFATGVVAGGLLVTINFHLLYRTLKKAVVPKKFTGHGTIIFKYYVRFVISGLIIFGLMSGRLVDPIGLILGLSIVVASMMAATVFEVTKLIFKEAV